MSLNVDINNKTLITLYINMASMPLRAQDPVTDENLAYDKDPALIGAVTAMMVLAIASVVLRFWLKLHRKVGLKLDDWLVGASMVPFCGQIAGAYIAVILGGVGEHFHVEWLEDQQRPKTTLQVSGNTSYSFFHSMYL